MTYELLKQLKEAGFPFIRVEHGMCCNQKEVVDFNPSGDSSLGAQHFFIPTLSELIVACGDDFENITRDHYDHTKWYGNAEGNEANYRIDHYDSIGATPEEAVANLYLALHTK